MAQMMEQTFRQRWDDYRLTKTQGFWISVGAVVAVLVLGFGVAGWVTAGTLDKSVNEAVEKARHELAAAICVEEFMAADDASGRLAKLKAASWFERSDLVAKAGWATMPDRKEPNSVVAGMCGAKLAELTVPVAANAKKAVDAK